MKGVKREMNLNANDYKHFNSALQIIKSCKMSKFEAKQELLAWLGSNTHGACKNIKNGECSRDSMLDVLLEVHDEYEEILAKLEGVEGGESTPFTL